MLFSEYAAFVRDMDQSVGKPDDERRDIAIYGLAAEVGSLLSVVKRAMLAVQDDPELVAARKRQEVQEEIGDVLWYTVSLSQQCNDDTFFNVFRNDIYNLLGEISAENERAITIETALTPERKASFLEEAEAFIAKDDVTLDDYQQLAFMTRRTEGKQLERICLALLSQLGAEVLRTTLPAIELDLNQKLMDRELNVVLAEIVWHLAALATLSGLGLGGIVEANRKKVTRRYGRRQPTPLPDDECLQHEQFPRKLQVSFVSVAKGRSRMYFGTRQLGNELTDNSDEEDGYRFHDVMHLAILAKLGWSPVLRKLMGRKRKSDPKADEVQDGARAQIVEELIVKFIHSEGTALLEGLEKRTSHQMFANRDLISFRFLSQLPRLASGLDAERNQFWEWEEAILEGSKLFHQLRITGQGTVSIDLEKRTIAFQEDVHVNLPGMIVGVGSSTFAVSGPPASAAGGVAIARLPDADTALKEAILASLGLDGASPKVLGQLHARTLDDGGVVVRAKGAVQTAMWNSSAISFRAAWARVGSTVTCSAFAMSDPRDSIN